MWAGRRRRVKERQPLNRGAAFYHIAIHVNCQILAGCDQHVWGFAHSVRVVSQV